MENLFFIYVFILILDVWLDWYRIEQRKRQIKHDVETVLAGLAYVAGTVAFVLITARDPIAQRSATIDGISLLVLLAPVRWIFHDLVLNVLRELPFDYLGREQQSAETDKLLRRLMAKGWNQFSIKFVALMAAFVLYFIIQILKIWLL